MIYKANKKVCYTYFIPNNAYNHISLRELAENKANYG